MSARTTIWASALRSISTLALQSAWPWYPQRTQAKLRPHPLRESGSRLWHCGQVWDVPGAGTGTSSEPYHLDVYASWRARSPGVLSRIALSRPAFCATFVPGASFVPLALAVMFFTSRSSRPTKPWFLVRSVVSVWVKSSRRRAWRASSFALSLMVLLSRFEYLPWLWRFAYASCRAFLRCRPRSLLASPGVSEGGMSRGVSSSETKAEHATPKSTPQPGLPFQGAGVFSTWTPKDTYQTPAFFLNVALRTLPPRGLDILQRCQPNFGSFTAPQCLLIVRTPLAWPGREKRSSPFRLSKRGNLAGWAGSQKFR